MSHNHRDERKSAMPDILFDRAAASSAKEGQAPAEVDDEDLDYEEYEEYEEYEDEEEDLVLQDEADAKGYVQAFLKALSILLLFAAVLACPFSAYWLYRSGDLGLSRAVEAQVSGELALFGPGMDLAPQDVLRWKSELLQAKAPSVVLLGAGTDAMRAAYFTKPALNLAGTCASMADFEACVAAILAAGRPELVILGVDFAWFAQQPKQQAPGQGKDAFAAGPSSLKLPWAWLFTGRISFADFFTPIVGLPAGRMGCAAWRGEGGFGPDGSSYPLALAIKGQGADAGFASDLRRLSRNLWPWARQEELKRGAIDAFAQAYYRLRAAGIRTIVFMPPVVEKLLSQLRADSGAGYPHLFGLARALGERGIDVVDFSDTASIGAGECEFFSARKMGEVASVRLLRELAGRRQDLLAFVNMERISRAINEWSGHAFVRDEGLFEGAFETDFLELGCKKRSR